jgi:hypothetical protein
MQCVAVVESVYIAVRTDCLHKVDFNKRGGVFTAWYRLIPCIKQVFITVVESVYSAVQTDCLHKVSFYNHG